MSDLFLNVTDDDLWDTTMARMVALRDKAIRSERIAEAAARAWVLMTGTADPMPAGVAIDYVQEVADDRREATQALLTAMTLWLSDLRPRSTTKRPEWNYSAGRIAGHLMAWHFADASADIAHLRSHAAEALVVALDPLTPLVEPANISWAVAERTLIRQWVDWCGHARHCYDLCCDLYRTAGPEGRK